MRCGFALTARAVTPRRGITGLWAGTRAAAHPAPAAPSNREAAGWHRPRSPLWARLIPEGHPEQEEEAGDRWWPRSPRGCLGAGPPEHAGLSHLSILITQRVMMEAVQHMTSMAMKTLQKRRPKIHWPPMRSVTLTKGMTARATERSASASDTIR